MDKKRPDPHDTTTLNVEQSFGLVEMVEPKGLIDVKAGMALRDEVIRLRAENKKLKKNNDDMFQEAYHRFDTFLIKHFKDLYEKEGFLPKGCTVIGAAMTIILHLIEQRIESIEVIHRLRQKLKTIGHMEEPEDIGEKAKSSDGRKICEATFGYLSACEDVIKDAEGRLAEEMPDWINEALEKK